MLDASQCGIRLGATARRSRRGVPWFFPIFLRAGASCDRGFLDQYPYFRKVRDAGGIKAYEKAHLKRLVVMLVHKFPQLPAAVHPNIVRHWAHVGDY